MCYFLCVKYYLIVTAIISFTIVYFIKRLFSAKMSLSHSDELSDDEVFFGKLTLKELKKHILWDKQQKTIHPTTAINSPICPDDLNESLKLLQAHSQPNLLNHKDTSNCNELDGSGWDVKAVDDSFIKMEDMVAKLCVSPKKSGNAGELNNTLEVIEYILNNPPSSTKDKTDKAELNNKYTSTENEVNKSPTKNQKEDKCKEASKPPEPPQNTPVKTNHQIHKHTEGFSTPRDMKQKPIFKTPAQPTSLKKPSATSLKKTPSRSNAYQHISSPVASYIKNCPIVPLVKDVHPKKPLPGTSSIPKIVKNTLPVAKPSNKENVNLPSVAYKSAKKTRVIDMPDDQKLPQSQWAKKIMTSLPRPLVMKHDHRELNYAKKKLMPQQEDSFADLSYHQAEVSVCTQKSAFKSNKNF